VAPDGVPLSVAAPPSSAGAPEEAPAEGAGPPSVAGAVAGGVGEGPPPEPDREVPPVTASLTVVPRPPLKLLPDASS
jgi:hypothetical protein